MRQSTKSKHELRLYELKKTVHEFIEFTENITLLVLVNTKAKEIAQAADALQLLLHQNSTASKLVKAVSQSEAAVFLDEVVDVDVIGELETYLVSVAATVENTELNCFLTEIMDKVESKYNMLLDKTHAYNALLKD